jgi:hypothetical protein
MKTILFLLLTTALAFGAEPTRNGGLSVHMLPDRVAKFSGGHGGFTVTDPATKKPGITYATPKELLAYFQQLPATVQQNGIWVVTTDPDSYSDSEQAKLKELIALCVGKDVPIYTCRASELPNGWKRAK